MYGLLIEDAGVVFLSMVDGVKRVAFCGTPDYYMRSTLAGTHALKSRQLHATCLARGAHSALLPPSGWILQGGSYW
jgi:hypothetical protein